MTVDSGQPATETVARVLRLGVVCALALLLAVCLGGCRYSESLYNIVTDQLAGELEENADPEYREVEGAPVDPTRASTTVTTSDNVNEQVQELPVFDESAVEQQQADLTEQSNTSNKNTQAARGKEASSEAGGATTGDEGEMDGAGESEEGVEQSGDDDETQADAKAGRGGTGQVYGEGSYDELPEARAIAARGVYAVVVQMLAGKGGLAACDREFLDTVDKTGAFSDEGVEDVVCVWKGKAETLDVDALIKTNADAILVDGETCALAEREEAQLTEAGIHVVSVPRLGRADTTDEEIATVVKVVAQLLSGRDAQCTFDAAAMSETWLSFHDDTIDACLSANGGYSYKLVANNPMEGIYQGEGETGEATVRASDNRVMTAFVDAVAPAAETSVVADREFGGRQLYLNGETVNAAEGIGLSSRVLSGRFALIDYYLQVSGVVNNAYDTAKPTTTDESDLTLPYAVVAGRDAGLLDIRLGSRFIPSALWFPLYEPNAQNSWTNVGAEDFPGLVVRDEKSARLIEKSASRVRGLYNVGEPYAIWVVPSGVSGSWADGTPESFLLSLWAMDVFYDEAGQPSSCLESVDSFYECFYRIEDASEKGVVEGLGVKLEATCPTS